MRYGGSGSEALVRGIFIWYVYACSPIVLASYICLKSPGVNRDSSFEAAILEKAPHCKIWGYDFSVSNVR